MLECKDPAIKLFGMKIPFPAVSDDAAAVKEKSSGDGEEEKSTDKDASTDKPIDVAAEQQTQDSLNSETSPEKKQNNNENDGNNSPNTKSKSGEENNNSKDQNENANPQDNTNHQTTKPLKKPDKILPCPRCNSMDTKFCYYNNYNINQPRHFCKSCQRYWTAGGTMRNVPVGAGRRKNKNSSSHYRHITISEALQAARIDSTHPALKSNGRVLSFGLEAQPAPICDSMASVLKLGDQKVLNGGRNGFHSFGEQRYVSRVENGDDCSSGSSVTTSNNQSMDETRGHNCRVQETQMMKNNTNVNAAFPCFSGVPWPYTWNPAIPPPGFFPPPGFPMPFYPYWSVPVLSPQSSSSSQKGSNSSGSSSPTLGKHSRDEENGKKDEGENVEDVPKQRNGCVLVPKTLRIDDPNEAAKSSIWATLGIKNELMSKGGMFKGFDKKKDEKAAKERKSEMAETSPVLFANPAALSRSLDFHERT